MSMPESDRVDGGVTITEAARLLRCIRSRCGIGFNTGGSRRVGRDGGICSVNRAMSSNYNHDAPDYAERIRERLPRLCRDWRLTDVHGHVIKEVFA